MSGKLHERDYMLTETEIRSAIADFDVDGGAPIVLGGVNATDKDCFSAVKYTAGKPVYVAYNPDFKYVMENGQKLPARVLGYTGTNLTGDVISCFKPEKGIIFGLEMGNVDGNTEPKVGQFLEPKANDTVYEIKDTQTADVPSFEVIDIIAEREMTGAVGQVKKNVFIVRTASNM